MKTESIGYWDLPQPDIKGYTNQWLPIPKMARTIPFGYVEDPDDSNILRPIKSELDALEKAKKYLKQYSYRDVANWLSEQSGRYISHVGLMKRVKLEQKRKRQASNQRYLAERYKEALQKAERLEERIGGRTEGLFAT